MRLRPVAPRARRSALIVASVPDEQSRTISRCGTRVQSSSAISISASVGATGRNRILKFEGCYHGHGDSLLVKAGSGALTFGVPTSPGVPAALAELTLTADYNDLDSVERLFVAHPDDIAAVIVEPVAGNMNCVLPAAGFLSGLRALCDRFGALLIFDEVMTGFRVHPRSATGLYGVRPDLITLGKIIGGGLPVGAFGGARVLMQRLAPVGPIYQAGTLSGNPLAMAAGIALLRALDDEALYQRLAETTAALLAGLKQAASAAGVPFTTTQIGSMFGLFFSDQPINGFADVGRCDLPAFNRFFHAMLDRGVYLAPSAYEAGFVSAAHGEAEIAHTLAAATEAFQLVAQH